MIEIRKAVLEDGAEGDRIFNTARAFMASVGNPNQWNDLYPSHLDVEEDSELGQGFVMCDDGKPFAYFAFILGEDPSYSYIEDGAWPNDKPYGTIHRIASDGTHKNVFHLCINYVKNIIPVIRIDTHEKNIPMQKALAREGFKYCGIVYIENGEQRLAFQLDL